MRYRVFLLSLSALLVACGGGPDHSSPKGVATSLAAAATAGDPATAVALLPPVAQLEAHFACEGEPTLVSRRNRRAESEEFGGDRMKGITMTVGVFDKDGSKTETLKVGDTWKDCKVIKEAKVHTSKLTLIIDKEGKQEDDGETWRFLELDGKWYFAKL